MWWETPILLGSGCRISSDGSAEWYTAVSDGLMNRSEAGSCPTFNSSLALILSAFLYDCEPGCAQQGPGSASSVRQQSMTHSGHEDAPLLACFTYVLACFVLVA